MVVPELEREIESNFFFTSASLPFFLSFSLLIFFFWKKKSQTSIIAVYDDDFVVGNNGNASVRTTNSLSFVRPKNAT